MIDPGFKPGVYRKSDYAAAGPSRLKHRPAHLRSERSHRSVMTHMFLLYECCYCKTCWMYHPMQTTPRTEANVPAARINDHCECLRCGKVWKSKKEVPTRCPKCGTRYWNTPVKEFSCRRCGHSWKARIMDYPNICPCCKSHRWDQPSTEFTVQRDAIDEDEVLDLYQNGQGLVSISIKTGFSIDRVMGVLRRNQKDCRISIRI